MSSDDPVASPTPMQRRTTAAIELGQALVALTWTAALFRLGGRRAVARTTRRAIAIQPAGEAATRGREEDVRRVCRAVARAKRLWPRPVRCLQTALVLQSLLRRHGVSATVVLGVRQGDSGLQAHAWVELGGWILDEARVRECYELLRPAELLQRPAAP